MNFLTKISEFCKNSDRNSSFGSVPRRPNLSTGRRGLEEREVRALGLHELRVLRLGLLLLLRGVLELLLEVVLHLREDALDHPGLRVVGAERGVRVELHLGW